MHRKKRRKLNHRFRILISIVLLVLIIFTIVKGFYFLTTSKTERDLKKLNYSETAITLIIDNELDEYLINKDIYSKTLETALVKDQYEKDLLEEYIYFPYEDYDSYITQLNRLNSLGYTRSDIEQVFKLLDKDEIDIIIEKDTLIDNLVDYIDNEYFYIDALDRYVSYKEDNEKYDCDKVISYVNMFLDYPYYEHDLTVSNPDDSLVIVNKYYKLGSDFVPKNLVKIDKEYADEYDRFVVPVVKEHFQEMASDMKKLGLVIKVNSAYRSYQTQVSLYSDYVSSGGKAYADSISARAGYSEHQTGLAVDVKDGTDDYGLFKDSDEYEWMIKNAHKYGFILRFPEDKTDITGYNFESWHFRYVGNDVAKYIYENKLTFDEYHSMLIAHKKD